MKKFWLILFMLLPLALPAQTHDCGGLVDFGFEQTIVKNFHFNLEAEGRFQKHFTSFDRLKVGTAFDYSFLKKKRLKVAAGAYYLLYNDEGIVENRWRIQSALTYTEKFTHLHLSYRVRVQSTFYDALRGDYSVNPKTYLRNRLQVEYQLLNKPMSFYASTEFFLRLYRQDYFVDQFRTILGWSFKLNKGNKISVFLRADNEIQVANPENVYYVGFSYNLKN